MCVVVGAFFGLSIYTNCWQACASVIMMLHVPDRLSLSAYIYGDHETEIIPEMDKCPMFAIGSS